MADLAGELIELEERLWKANREGDGQFYADNLRDDALGVSRFGVVTKEQVVPLITVNRNPFVRSETSDHRVVQLTEDSAFITYKVSYTAALPDGEQDFTSLVTSVYTREGDRWLVVLNHQTAL